MTVSHQNTAQSLTQTEGHVCLVVASPWGDIVVRGNDKVIRSIRFQPGQANANIDGACWVVPCRQQLTRYCTGQLTRFDLPLKPQGTAFQQRVWQALQHIPYGSVCSYQDIAKAIDNEGAVRAVASANAKNPISLAIPCHRVIGSDRALRGYAGGLALKAKLLELEGHRIEGTASSGDITKKTKLMD